MCMQVLIRLKANLDATGGGENAGTALHRACQQSQAQAASLLLDSKAQVDVLDGFGQDALM